MSDAPVATPLWRGPMLGGPDPPFPKKKKLGRPLRKPLGRGVCLGRPPYQGDYVGVSLEGLSPPFPKKKSHHLGNILTTTLKEKNARCLN